MASKPRLITFEGEARSGKGTSARTVRQSLLAAGHRVVYIDQGQKFRAFARLALDRGVALTDQLAVGEFLEDLSARTELLHLLSLVAKMEQPEVEALLYTPEVSTGSARIGSHPRAQQVVMDVLLDQVRGIAGSESADIILIDGRDLIVKAHKMEAEGIAELLLGFFFRCDAAIAARRTEGIFVDLASMDTDEKLRLLDAIVRISERNRQDALRGVHPLREPMRAYPLHTLEFRPDDEEYVTQATREALASGVVSVNTSYTRSVQEMTDPVVALVERAMRVHSTGQ